jgi:hypothetical protein
LLGGFLKRKPVVKLFEEKLPPHVESDSSGFDIGVTLSHMSTGRIEIVMPFSFDPLHHPKNKNCWP